MPTKRQLVSSHDAAAPDDGYDARAKRPRPSNGKYAFHGCDFFAKLSDELVLRVLSFMDHHDLLDVSRVSQRLYRIASDSQLWRTHFYRHFVMPRSRRRVSFKAWRKSTAEGLNWKRQYRLRHNWTQGACAVQEVRVHDDEETRDPHSLVKVVDGLAVTADLKSGLRAWDLRSRRLLAHTGFTSAQQPTCVAVDDQKQAAGRLEVAAGFADGTFCMWGLDTKHGKLRIKHTSSQSCMGTMAAMAYSHPYIMTATDLGYISLYRFEGEDGDMALKPLKQITALKSHSARLPVALSIRRMATTVVASIAYTFDAVTGWGIGIQDLDVKADGRLAGSRVAFTVPMQTGRLSNQWASSANVSSSLTLSQDASSASTSSSDISSGPKRLCYRHPYMLVTLPDNTLLLHVCTASATALSIGPGVRLWGHTSGISDAEVTPRGKAVSVSTRGDEIRLWELEGQRGSSVQVRPRLENHEEHHNQYLCKRQKHAEDAKRNWVGFDDEMVVVLENGEGGEKLMVYDFT